MTRRHTAVACALAAIALALPALATAQPDPDTPPLTATVPASTAPGVQVGPPLPAPTGGPTDTTTIGGDQASHPHFWDLPGRIKQAINDWFKGLVVDALTPMLDLVGKTVLSTPQLTSDGQVAQLWRISLISADALLVLFVLVGAALAMSHETMQTRYALKDLLGRLAFAGIAINASLALTGQLIELANALAQGFLGGGGTAAAAGSLNTLIVGALSGGGIFITLLGLACAAVAVVLLVLYLVRAAILVVLVCGAPLLLLCHLFPQTEGLAQLWWRALAACLGIQVAQALVLAAAVRVFFAGPGGTSLGLSVSGAVIDMLVCLCLLYVLVKIPFWAKDLAFSSRGPSTPVRLARTYVARQTGLPRGLL